MYGFKAGVMGGKVFLGRILVPHGTTEADRNVALLAGLAKHGLRERGPAK